MRVVAVTERHGVGGMLVAAVGTGSAHNQRASPLAWARDPGWRTMPVQAEGSSMVGVGFASFFSAS